MMLFWSVIKLLCDQPSFSSSSVPPPPPPPSGDDRYAAIAGLDEAVGAEAEGERWSDRTAIITRLDHEEYAR